LLKDKIDTNYKWVFKIKYKVYETLKRYKSRLVAKRYTNIDYLEMFSLTANNKDDHYKIVSFSSFYL